MKWSWDQYEDCPVDVIDRIREKVAVENHERNVAAKAAELKRKHGH